MAYITLNKKSFFKNLDIISQRVGSVDKIALVLKDNAYGHGLELIAKLAKEYGVTKAVVRDTAEADVVKNYIDDIIILADAPLRSNSYSYTINSLESLKKFAPRSIVELKIDSGMHRNGISPDQIEEAFTLIKAHALKLKGIFTHHSSADTLGSEFFVQEQKFAEIKKRSHELMITHGFTDIRFHSLNSAGVFRRENFKDVDIVRVGIAAYGCLEMDRTLFQPQLRPLLSLHAKKISTRELKKAQRVGYNGIYSASKDMLITNYDVGYADGLLRTASNSYTSADGKKLLGRISMDNSTFEGESEEITVFSNASQFAKSAKTISYEVLTSLKPHLKRVVI